MSMNYEFSVDYNITDTSNITDMKNWYKKTWYKTLLGIIKKCLMCC